ncbi:hypothetical protein PanWU01x14_154190 [Parasponia andersonii]|uniref:Uncharacterized protein n=1 Tax=Parasponia andersonii TaxID=3476 RepID=A0A2P5CGT0_PARAD|nr:hypothetical protein PanWU01x14_154190 [Parasponia andersonii]
MPTRDSVACGVHVSPPKVGLDIQRRIYDLDDVSVDCAIVISPRKQSLTYKQCGFDGVNV